MGACLSCLASLFGQSEAPLQTPPNEGRKHKYSRIVKNMERSNDSINDAVDMGKRESYLDEYRKMCANKDEEARTLLNDENCNDIASKSNEGMPDYSERSSFSPEKTSRKVVTAYEMLRQRSREEWEYDANLKELEQEEKKLKEAENARMEDQTGEYEDTTISTEESVVRDSNKLHVSFDLPHTPPSSPNTTPSSTMDKASFYGTFHDVSSPIECEYDANLKELKQEEMKHKEEENARIEDQTGRSEHTTISTEESVVNDSSKMHVSFDLPHTPPSSPNTTPSSTTDKVSCYGTFHDVSSPIEENSMRGKVITPLVMGDKQGIATPDSHNDNASGVLVTDNSKISTPDSHVTVEAITPSPARDTKIYCSKCKNFLPRTSFSKNQLTKRKKLKSKVDLSCKDCNSK